MLQTRLTFSDLRFATSFYDYRIAKMAVQSMLEQCYEEKIAAWLTGIHSDFLVLKSDTGKGIGYGYRREDEELHEGLRKIRLVLEKQPERDWALALAAFLVLLYVSGPVSRWIFQKKEKAGKDKK